MVAGVSISTAPTGSVETTINPTFGPEVVGSTALDALANSTESAALIYSNPSGKTYATVDILLNPISPTGTPSIQIISGSTVYELAISTTASIARKARFVDIPASFLSSFTVKNLSGVALAASGNYVVITPQY
jgi:hypothetical protein